MVYNLCLLDSAVSKKADAIFEGKAGKHVWLGTSLKHAPKPNQCCC